MTLPDKAEAVRKPESALEKSFDLAFFLFALPFAWIVSRNIAVRLRFEDALIVLRYARNIAEGNGFVFNYGERLLGVTTPLHTLISAVFVFFGKEHAPAVQNVAGVIFLVLEAWLATRIVRRTHSPFLAGLVAVVLLCNLNYSYLYFGMETHFFAFLILLAFHLFTLKKEALTGLVLGLAFLTRFDAALLALLIGLAYVIEKRRLPLALIGGFSAVVAPWLLFSLVYFHSILPESLGAKKNYYPALAYLRFIFDYYLKYFAAMVGMYTANGLIQGAVSTLFPVVAFAGCVRWLREAWQYGVLIGYAAGQVLVYAVIGPDPGFHWHYYILNPVLTLLFLIGLYELVALGLRLVSPGSFAIRDSTLERVLAILLLVATLPAAAFLFRSLDYKYELDPHSKQLYAIADWLNARYDDETSLLQPSIGILGYATNMRMIDHAGLVTPGLYYYDGAHHTPMPQVLSRFQPDLVLVPEGEEPALPAHGYELVTTFHEPRTYLLFERQGQTP